MAINHVKEVGLNAKLSTFMAIEKLFNYVYFMSRDIGYDNYKAATMYDYTIAVYKQTRNSKRNHSQVVVAVVVP